jgi:serine/threonine-protein kinase
MATVFLVHDLRHKRPVALKVLHPELASTLGPERFQREIETVARLQHPNILTVHDSGETAGQLWFTMPFVEGESLRDRLRREQQLPVEVALRIATDAARALQYAHDHGVIHRDIKPENLLLTTDGSTLVADFGIARAVTAGDDRLTETGMSVGTPTYMSPEQSAGDRHLDARTDVYSLGTVLYEMLAGEPPFTGATAQTVIAKRLSGEVPRLRHARPSVPESLEQAVTRALAPLAADRFASAAEFGRALHATTATPTGTPAARPRAAEGRARRRIPLAALTLGLGILIGLGVLFAWRQSHHVVAKTGSAKVLAVLPFENLGDSADAYFADGVGDEVRGKLSQLRGLAVAQIARELGVQYLFTATVRWDKHADGTSKVRVSPELVSVTTGGTPTTKWQQGFEAALTDVFQVQADIAGQVAQALNVALGDSTKQKLATKPTQSLTAYDSFLQGEAATQEMQVSGLASLRKAIAAYEQAVALDSVFAQAWAGLARAQALLYSNSTPTPAVAEAARSAAGRTWSHAPTQADSHQALGTYSRLVLRDHPRALAEDSAALVLSPGNAEILSIVGLDELTLGRWEGARQHLEQAVRLDPRSVAPIRRLGEVLLYTRHYPEAEEALDQALLLMPANLGTREDRAMVELAQGNLASAQAVLRAAPKEVDATVFGAFLATYNDLIWVLDPAQQQVLLRLTPSDFDDDRGTWGLVIAQTYGFQGNVAKSQVYADSARLAYTQQLRDTPKDALRHAALGLALSYLGHKGAAIREGEHAVALVPIPRDAVDGAYIQHQLARIYLLVGEPEKALDQLEPLLKTPYYLSPGWLKIDPNFVPLRGNPRFERLVNGS